MNSLATGHFTLVQYYMALRNDLMAILADDDFTFQPTGNPTLGTLCREMGDVQRAYNQSFKTFTLDFSYTNPNPALESSVAKLQSWYADLDAELKATIEGLSEDDVQNKKVDRGHNFIIPLQAQLSIYTEALVIFYGKASVYLRMMGKTLPERFEEWIG